MDGNAVRQSMYRKRIRFDYTSSVDTDKQPALSQITDTRGRAVTFGYSKGRLTSMADAAGGRSWSYGYDRSTSERLTSFALTAYGLGSDNVNRNATTSFAYDASDRLTQITDPRGNATTFTYDGTNRRISSMTQVLDPNAGTGPTTRFTYSSTVNKCSDEAEAVAETRVDGPRTDVEDITTYCVDKHDRVVATIDAKGHKAGKKYTSNSNVAQLNESGVAGGPAYDFSFSQDNNNNLTGVSLPTGGQASLDYQDTGNKHLPTGIKDFSTDPAAAATWVYDYDDNGNLIEANNPLENITYRYCYNADGTVARVAQPDLDGLPLDENTSADGCAGHAQGNDTLMSYNSQGELARLDPPGPNRTQTFTYDALSRIKTLTDGRGVVQTYTYDALDRVVEIRYDEPTSSGTTSTTTDTTSTEALIIPPDDEDTKQTWIKYSYDPNGNMTARSDASGNTTFQFDALNRMTKESPESPSAVVTYSYDPAGNVTSILTSDAPRAVTYTFDKTNLTTSVTGPEGRTTRFEHDKNGNRTSTAYANRVTMAARFDDSNRMTCTYAYTGTAPGASADTCPDPATSMLTFFEYSYQATLAGIPTDTNRREQVTDRTGAVTKYAYDAMGRLTGATTTDTAGTTTRKHDYSYDKRSNMTQEKVSGSRATAETRSQAYTGANELCWVATGDHAADCSTTPAGAETVSYDAAGKMTGIAGGVQMGYSLRGHMVTVTPPGLAAINMEYTDATQDRRIEADGLRMSYSQLGLVSQAPTNGSSKATWFVRDPHQKLVGMLHADDTKTDLYYLFDGLGSVAATTDLNGQIVQRYEYEPYGEQINPATGDTNPWRYASGYYDSKTGMLKFGTRYYMPDLTRWTQPDPVFGKPSNPVTLNAYGYVGGNPSNNTDPSGRLLASLVEDVYEIYDAYSDGEDIGTLLYDASDGGFSEMTEDVVESGLFGAAVTTTCVGAITLGTGGIGALAATTCGVAGEVAGEWGSSQSRV